MRVFSNTAVALDGRIGTVDGASVNVGSDEDRRRMGILRAKADAVLVGGATFRMGPTPIIEPVGLSQDGVRRPLINAVLTRSGIASHLSGPWAEPRAALHVFGPATLDAAAHQAVGAEVHHAGDPAAVLDQLEAMGCRSVLVEGGGDLIFQLVASGRLDTIHMTLVPRIIGGRGAPSLADGLGFTSEQIQAFRLVDLEVVGDELFLRYDVSG
jgi:2,5-diamino-6-(ribosylamino)-4(3H)-pyrimidinone 5'-phosphate reductase